MKTSIFRSIRFRIIILFVLFGVLLVSLVYAISLSMVTRMEETLVADRLNADINYIEDLIALSDVENMGDGTWNVREDGGIYLGNILVGDGTHEKANLDPFLVHEEKTGTFSYVFIKCGDEGLGYVEATPTAKGYQEGHFLRVAGSTRDPDGNSIVGTYMDILVADVLDAHDTYGGEANVAGGMIYCRYNTLKNAQGEVVGAIVVGRNISELQAQVGNVMQTMIAATIGVVVLLILVMMWIVSRWTSAISAITAYIRRITGGDIPPEDLPETNSRDEIGVLVKGVNSMTASLRENEVLRIKSETDQLTGLANRFGLNRFADDIFEDCYKNGKPLGVGIMDIDYFKPYNDHYGHQEGDKCIVMLANVLKKVEEKEHVHFARFGGDEFMMLCAGYDIHKIEQIAREVLQSVYNANRPHAYSEISDRVTVSQGFCVGVPVLHQRLNDYIHMADGALYDIKMKSKNDFKVVQITDDFRPSIDNVGISSIL